jgi:hypothetical protein
VAWTRVITSEALVSRPSLKGRDGRSRDDSRPRSRVGREWTRDRERAEADDRGSARAHEAALPEPLTGTPRNISVRPRGRRLPSPRCPSPVSGARNGINSARFTRPCPASVHEALSIADQDKRFRALSVRTGGHP